MASNPEGDEEILDVESEEYKKQVILRGILQVEASNFNNPSFYIFTIVPLVVAIIYTGFTGLIPSISVRTCSATWVVVFVLYLLIEGALCVGAVYYLNKVYKAKVYSGYRFHETDWQFTIRNGIKYNIFTIIGGWISSFLGNGGSTVYIPLLNYLDKPPQVSAATGMNLVFMNSVTSLLYFSG
jgi:hypothetical protein